MTEIAIFILIVALIIGFGWARQNLLGRAAKPLSRTDERVEFPFLVTLSIQRNEIPLLHHSGVYDAIAVQRNRNALELRLINSTDPKVIDPFSFFVPRDGNLLASLSAFLSKEAQLVDREGSAFSK